MPTSHSSSQSSLSLPIITCPIHRQPANLICLQAQCQSRGIICPQCLFSLQELHKQHKTKPLKKFISQFLTPSINSQNLILYTTMIDKLKNDIVSHLNEKIKKQQDKQQLKRSVKNYYEEIKEMIDIEFNKELLVKEYIQNITNNQSNNNNTHNNNNYINSQVSLQSFNNFLKSNKLLDQTNNQSQQTSQNLTNQQKYLLKIKQLLSDKLQQLIQYLKSKKYTINDILSLFTFIQTKQKTNFHFSQTLKHSSIKIKDKFKATQQHNYSANFALIQPMVQGKKKSTKKKSIKIKIDKLNSWITLGICIKSKAIQKNYYFDTGYANHGTFAISYDGYTWLHQPHSGDPNSQYQGWSFEQGDTIKMTFDPKQKIIKYQKQNSSTNPFQIKYQPQPGEQLYFCVTLNSNDQSVSIVQ